jgi:hypothetical protein
VRERAAASPLLGSWPPGRWWARCCCGVDVALPVLAAALLIALAAVELRFDR